MMSIPVDTGEESRLGRLQEIPASGAVRGATRLLRSLAPAEVSHLLESLPPAEREIVWDLSDDERSGQILLLTTVTYVVGFLSFLGLGGLFLV